MAISISVLYVEKIRKNEDKRKNKNIVGPLDAYNVTIC